MVYYGSDGAGGIQTLDRPLRTITTLDRFAYVRPNEKGRVRVHVAADRIGRRNGIRSIISVKLLGQAEKRRN